MQDGDEHDDGDDLQPRFCPPLGWSVDWNISFVRPGWCSPS